MNIRAYLLLTFTLSGLMIAVFTSFMTYVIIDEPIGMKMFSKIILTILATLPVIAYISYRIGLKLSSKFDHIQDHLKAVENESFEPKEVEDYIYEIKAIHASIDTLSKRLESSMNTLLQKNKDLSLMVNSFAHDFKTPLTIIDGYLEEIEDGLIAKEEMPKVIDTLKKETAYLDEITVDVLHFMQAMKSKPTLEPIVLLDFVQKEVVPLLTLHDEITLYVDIPETITIEFAPTDLKKVLVNLLQNSLKFTEQGYIRIAATHVILTIEDTGIGIPEGYREKVFEPFFTVDKSKNRQKSGFGLGLSISKHLCQNNGYTLQLDGQYQRGARFFIAPL